MRKHQSDNEWTPPHATASSSASRLIRRRPMPQALEQRFMFDGAAIATTLDATHQVVDKTVTVDGAVKLAEAPAPTPTPATEPSGAKQFVFIDTTVPDWQTLAGAVTNGARVITLDPNQDGLKQIAAVLADESGVTSIHILSHGSAGDLIIGSHEYTTGNLGGYAAELDAIGHAMASGGDIMLYGCNIGQGTAGQALIDAVAHATGDDVAASTDLTGAAALGGDWTLEAKTGAIDASSLATATQFESYTDTLATVSLNGATGWTPIMYGVAKDPAADSQANAADTDIIGDATHGSLYVAYDTNGTATTADDMIAFRIRIDNPTSATYFGGVAIVGIDANLDGRIDVFLSVDGRNNGQVIRILDPGTGLNNSPSTTTTSPLPTGWLANNGVYAMTASNYSVVAVDATTDSNWGTPMTGFAAATNSDLNGDGKTDVFVNFKLPMSDLATVLAIPSPTDRNGNYGPRGATGIQNYNKDTVVQYVNFTQTQFGPINGDLNGVSASYDKNATFASLGALTAPMSASDPVSAASFAHITSPVDANGLVNASEDNAVSVSGTATAGGWVKLTVSDGAHSNTVWQQADGSDNWNAVTGDLSGFNEGTLTFSALLVNANGSSSVVANSSGDSTTAIHDTLPPTLAITPLATAGRPTISGTSSDVSAGSTVTLSIDPNGDGVLSDLVTYTALVGSGGAWSVNTGAATPASGSLAASGLTAYAKITVSGQDAAGNTGTATAIDKPVVNSLTTNSLTPTINGSWGGSNGGTDSLAVTVNGVTYTTGSGLVISDKSWSVTLSGNTGPNALSAGNNYEVVATTTRSSPAGSTSDASSTELHIIAGPSVDIGNDGNGTAGTTSSTTPTITGVATPNAVVVLRIDKDGNDATTNDRVTYATTADGSGNWSVDTSNAVPISGTMPSSGLSGTVNLLATVTDNSNNTATDTKALTITVPSISIASVSGALPSTSGIANDGILNASEDDAAVILIGATNVATNQTIAVTVSDGVHSNVTGTATYDAASGKWKTTLNLSSLNDGTNNLSLAASFNSGQATASATLSHDSKAYASVASAQTTSTNPVVAGTADATSASLVIKVDRYTKQGGSILYKDTTYYSVAGGTVGGYTTTSGVSFSSGAWSLTVNQSGGTFNNTGEYLLVSTIGSDSAGNSISASGQVTKIANSGATPATVAINTIAGDGIINEAEDDAVVISGTTNVSGGYVLVTLSDGTNSISQEVQAGIVASGGLYTWTLSARNLDTWKDGTILVEAKQLAASGSSIVSAEATATPTHTNTVVAAPTIVVTTPIGDGNLSASEDGSVSISGTTTNAVGSTVTVTVSLSGTTKTGTAVVASDGTWTASFDAAHSNALSSLADGTLSVSASVTANSQTATANGSVLHDRTPPVITVTPLATAGYPTISGTTDLTAGSTLTVTIDPDNISGSASTVSYQVTVQSGGTWLLDLSAATPSSGALPADGLTNHANISVTGSDAAGNSTTTVALDKPVVDTQVTASLTPTVTGNWTSIVGDNLYVVINGVAYKTSGDVTSSVTLGGTTYSGGTLTTGLTASGDTWSLTIPGGNALSAAGSPYNVTAYAVRSGSQTADTTSGELVIDRSAPAVAISTISNDSGVAADFLTNDTTLVFAGTAEANSNVLVILRDSDNNIVFSTSVVAAGGTWSMDRSGQTALSDGNYSLSATATDAAGNSATATQAVVIDTTATIGITTNYKSLSTTPVITGSSDLEAGRDITVTISGATYTVQTQTGGAWSLDLATATPSAGSLTPLVDGNTYTITASGSDLAGNSANASKSMVIDTTAPNVHIGTPLDWNGSPVNDTLSITEDTNVIIKGTTAKGASATALAGSTLAISITDGITTITDVATVQSDGSWELAPLNLRALASGVITVSATYVDAGGVAYTDTATVLHDKTASVTIDSISNDSGALGDFITSDNTLVFHGSATAGATVTVTLDGNVLGTTTAASNGNWSFDHSGISMTDGSHTLQAAVGSSSVTQAIEIDTGAPSGPVTVNAQTTQQTMPTITGSATLASGETLSVTVDGITYSAGDGNLSVDAMAHTWSLTIPADKALTQAVSGGFDGVYSVTATIRDTAGNVLNDSTSSELAIVAAPAGTVTIDAMTHDSAAADFITNDGVANRIVTGTVSIALGSNEVVEVSFDGGSTWTTANTSGTSWSVTDPANHNSNWTLKARVTNIATTLSGTVASQAVIYDATIATPTVTLVSDSSDGASGHGGDLKSNDAALSFSAPAGDVTRGFVLDGGSASGSYVAPTNQGSHTLVVTDTDVAGNTASASLTFTLDTVAPLFSSAVVVGDTLTLSYAEAGTGFSGVTPANGDFSIKVNGTSSSPTVISIDTSAKTVTLTLASAALSGDTVTVSYTPGSNALQDVAGNTAVSLSDHAVTNNTLAPGAPTSTVTIDAMTHDSAVADFITNDGSANRVVSGTVSTVLGPNEVVEVSFDGGSTWTTATMSGTNWSITDPSSHNSNWTLEARVTDTSSSLSGVTASQAVTYDAAIATPTVVLTSDTSDGASGHDSDLTSNDAALTFNTPAGDVTRSFVLDGGSTSGAYAAPSTEGAHTLVVNDTDTAGNTVSASITFTLDTVAPLFSAAVVDGNTLTLSYAESSSGFSSVTPANGDFAVKVNGASSSPTAISIDSVAKTVTLTLAGAVQSGDSVTVSYTPGSNALQDIAGNTAVALTDQSVTNNTLAPGAPTSTVTIDAMTHDSAAADFITNDGAANRVVTGTVSTALGPNEVVEVSFDGGSTWTTATMSGTNWSVTDPSNHTSNWTLKARVNDTMSSLSGLAATQIAVFDATIAAPTVLLVSDSSDGASGHGSDLKSNDATLFFNTPSGDVTRSFVLDGGSASGSYAAPSSQGTHTLVVTDTDTAGNTASASITFTLDTVAPLFNAAAVNGTVVTLSYIESGSGFSNVTPAAGDFAVRINGGSSFSPASVGVDASTKTITLTLAGTVQSGDTVTVSYTPGTNAVQDIAGNAAVALIDRAIVNNTSAPVVPAVTVAIDAMTHDSALADFITNDGAANRAVTGTVSTTLGPNEVVEVSFDGGATWSVATTSGMHWSVTDPSSHHNSWSMQARVTNPVSSLSGSTATQAAVFDAMAPTAPTVDALTTTETNPTLTGTATLGTGESLTVNVNGVSYAVGDGHLSLVGAHWTLRIPAANALGGGSYDVVAAVTDTAGNTAADATASELTVALRPPQPPQTTVQPIVSDLAPPTPAAPSLPVPDATTIVAAPPVAAIADDRHPQDAAKPIDDIYTRSGSDAMRIAVMPSDEPALLRYHGVPDQYFEADKPFKFQLPVDAFVHTKENAVVKIHVQRADGGALPDWLHFNAATGTFDGKVPADGPGEIAILVIARDEDGRQATTIFRLKLSHIDKTRPSGRASLSEQMQKVHARPGHLDLLARQYVKQAA